MNETVFVAGVHGAGKSTICTELSRLLGASHVTAGGLIRASADATTEVTVGLKAVPNIDANQQLLLRGLSIYRATNSGPLLLDGHFVLLKPDGTMAEIPLTVYAAIAPAAVMLVEADTATVHSRLLERDNAAPPAATITELAARERVHAERVRRELRIPLWLARGDGETDKVVVEAASRIRSIIAP